MGWFDEQIRQRKAGDEKAFQEVFMEISDSVTGKNISKTFLDAQAKAENAIGEIIAFYGGRMPERPAAFKDINEEIEYICRPNGIMRRSVKLKKDWYKDAIGAYLAYDTKAETYTALVPEKSSGRYAFLDSTSGKREKIGKRNADRFSVDAICFYKPLPLRKLTVKDFVRYGLSMWTAWDIAMPILLTVLMTGLGLIIPRLSHYLFSDIVEGEQVNLLLSTILFMACIGISSILFGMIHTLITEKNRSKIDLSMEAAVMMRVLSLPTGFFKNYASGEIRQRVEYANSLSDTFVDLIFNSGITAVLSISYISQIAVYAKPLLVPSLITILAVALFSVAITFAGISFSKKTMEAAAKESGVSYSLINGVQKIKLAGAEKRAFVRWGKSYAPLSDLLYSAPLLIVVSRTVTLAISLIGMIFIYFRAVRTGLSVADFYAFETAYAMVSAAFLSLADITDMIAGIGPTIDMIRPIMDEVPEVSEGKQFVPKLGGAVELSNVSFRYSETMPMVLDNLSLRIRSGQYVAIVGKTGCGKSTLMRILLGFEKPLRGAVYYDGKDLSGLDLKSLRRNIGTVMQNGKLFQGDLYSNITISAPWLTMEEAWEAAEMAGIADEIRRMPMGMQTLVSDGGGGMSGGQRQRLMIARAIAPKPGILIFDEATSALDNITQKIVSDSLDSLKCTRIVIAHRLSTIRHCDRIIFLDGGKIVEDGSYDELMALNGKFAELVRRQQLDTGAD